MSATLAYSNQRIIDCDVDITLPRDFVHEWAVSTGKQSWMAQTMKYEKRCSEQSIGCSSGVATAVTYSEGVPALLETDTAVTKDNDGQQKMYLCVKITGVQLHLQNRTLQITVLDVKGKEDNDEGSAELDVSMVSEDTGVRQAVSASLPNKTAEFTETLTLNSVDHHIDQDCDQVSQFYLTNPIMEHAGTVATEPSDWLTEAAAYPLESQPTEDQPLTSCHPGESQPTEDQPLTLHHPGESQPTEDQPLTLHHPGESQPTEDQPLTLHHPGDSKPTEDQLLTSCHPGESQPTEDQPLTLHHPGESQPTEDQLLTLHHPGESQPTEDQPLTLHHPGQSKPTDQPLTSHHFYRLRGKKLSFCKLSACEFDFEEAHDTDYQPHSRPSTKKLHQARSHIKKGDDLTLEDRITKEKESQHKKDQCNSGSEKDANSEISTVQHSVKTVTPNLPMSASSPPNRKRQQQSSPASESPADSEPPPRKKRMKIITENLPSFARRVPNKAKKAVCRYCRRKFCDYAGVTVHVKKFHRGEKNLEEYLQELQALSVTKCSLCDQQFDNRFRRQLHEDKVHFKAGKMQCDQCGKAFPNTVLLKQHIRSVHLIQGQGHLCSVCSARFKWAATLKSHLAEVHEGVRDLVCKVCGRRFHRQSQLNRHSIIHGPEEAKLACELCGRKFWHPSNLQRHVTIVHRPQNESWHCAYCGKGFHRKEGWSNHVEKVHFSLFPHNCTICKVGFIRQTLLKKHMAAKHGEAGFQAPAARRTHFKYNRSERDELVCGLCEAKFCYKAQLVQHVFQVHHDTFPFSCDVCQQVFMERSFLTSHRQRAHQLQPGPEDAELDVEQDAYVQGSTAEHSHQKNTAPQAGMKTEIDKNSTETDAVILLDENTHTIRLENAESGAQYVIQIPEGLTTVPSDAIILSIANLVSTEQSMQEAQKNVDSSASHELSPGISCPEGKGAPTVAGEPQENSVPDRDCIDTSSECPQQDLDLKPPPRVLTHADSPPLLSLPNIS